MPHPPRVIAAKAGTQLSSGEMRRGSLGKAGARTRLDNALAADL
jgi:hypothetical protein